MANPTIVRARSGLFRRLRAIAALASTCLAMTAGAVRAAPDEDRMATATMEDAQEAGIATSQSATAGYFRDWFVRSDRAKESQPHWMTPVLTVTPRLEQEYRYDQLRQERSHGVNRVNFGLNKGLELIPTERTELIISVPGYIRDSSPAGHEEGWADETLLLKVRFLSENEEHGDYMLTGFLGLSSPTGSEAFTTHQTVWTPTIAGGKGWGSRSSGFDIQSTLGISWGDVDQESIGEPVVWNTAFQWHVLRKLWPELEVNYTHWLAGGKAGEDQTALAAGLVLGRYELGSRARFVVGVAYQQAISSFRTFDNSWVLTLRVPF